MIAGLINHLWQSTLFGVAVALTVMALRKNRAAVRYGLWLAASVKFLAPFALLVGLGSLSPWTPVAKTVVIVPTVSYAVEEITAPFVSAGPAVTNVKPREGNWTARAMAAVWLCGFAAIMIMRFRSWRRVRAAVRASTPMDAPAPMEVRAAPGLLEPGVVGLLRPILLVPCGITECLTESQWQAVLAHEACHVWRRNNLTSAVHMVVEAIFWFHPLVWWIGARMMGERERACDEAVLQLGQEPGEYAQGILSVCKSYLESPLSCVSGVTGADLKKRIHAILAERVPGELSVRKKAGLGVAAMAAVGMPVAIGVFNGVAAVPKFVKVSVKPCEVYSRRPLPDVPGRLQTGCTSLNLLIMQAYGRYANGHMNPLSSPKVDGGPAWIRSDLYQIDGSAPGQTQAMMNGPMLQAVLADRFQLHVSRLTETVPVYELTASKGALSKLTPFVGTCTPWDSDEPAVHREPDVMCGRPRNVKGDGFDMQAAGMLDLCFFLNVMLDRPVIDKTGITGRFDFHMEVPTEWARHGNGRGLPSWREPGTPTPVVDPSFVAAAKEAVRKLGLALEPKDGPSELLVIDSVAKPY